MITRKTNCTLKELNLDELKQIDKFYENSIKKLIDIQQK